MCGLEIKLEGDKIVSIRGDELDPFSQGHICPKATALEDVYNDPNRLNSLCAVPRAVGSRFLGMKLLMR